jgi:hypothetical protein
MTTHAHELYVAPETPFTAGERLVMEALRLRYREDPDLFSDREHAHLLFLRWLVRTHRLDPSGECSTAELPRLTWSPGPDDEGTTHRHTSG